MPKTMTGAVLVSSIGNGAGSVTRGRLDCSTADGGMIRWAMTNGGTGPTVPCTARVMVARKQAALPAAAGEGTGDDDWKVVLSQDGSAAPNERVRGSYAFGREVAYLQIEFAGNQGQAVTVECTGDTHAST